MAHQSPTRTTKQRTVILETLRGLRSHPTADEIYHLVREKLPKISLGTVYRNLELLANAGEILRLERAGSQKRFDGNSMPHQHARCRKCGRIVDVDPPLVMHIPELPADTVPGFHMESVEVELVGRCDRCLSA